MKRFIVLAALVSISAALIWPVPVAQAQSPITFGETTYEMDFPNGITFWVPVKSSAGEIVKAKLVYGYVNAFGSESVTPESVTFEPASNVELEHTFDTSDIAVPPSAPIQAFWRVEDAAGNRAESERVFLHYDDQRYDWQVRENELISVWWHDKPQNFGQQVFDIASAAVKRQHNFFQAELQVAIHIIIYNDQEEFQSWHTVEHEWVGGEAYTEYGITTQIVPGKNPDAYWLNNVIPHEISHLYFAQVTYNPMVSIPVWLNEGIAQYNEFSDNSWVQNEVEQAAREGKIMPLSSLANGFGAFNEERVYLSYYEALSAVNYMVEVYGEESISQLLAAYHAGNSTDEAFQIAFGRTMEEFERDWAAWLGIPADEYIIPTPWALPTFRPSPTYGQVAGGGEAQATEVPAATDTPLPEPTAIEEPLAAEQDDAGQRQPAFPVCASFLLPVPLLVILLSKRSRLRPRH